MTGQLYIKTLPNGDAFTYTYDNAGNTTQVVGTQSGKDTLRHTYTYDLAGNLLTAEEYNVTRSFSVNKTTYTYDNINRCLTESYSVNGTSYKKTYTYDGKSVTDFKLFLNNSSTPDYEEQYQYDYTNGRLNNIYYYNGGADTNTNIGFGYDTNGNTTEYCVYHYIGSDLNIAPLDYTYNLANLPTGVTQAKCGFFPYGGNYGMNGEQYTYYLNGNLKTKIFDSDVAGAHDFSQITPAYYTNYTYDGMNRLTDEAYGIYSGQIQNLKNNTHYAFDTDSSYSNGYKNTITYTDYTNSNNNTTTTDIYNKANQIQEQVKKNYNNSMTLSDITFAYDTAGNLTTKQSGSLTVGTYTYDTLNVCRSIMNIVVLKERISIMHRIKESIKPMEMCPIHLSGMETA